MKMHLHLQLQTGDGRNLIDVKADPLFPAVFTPALLDTAEQTAMQVVTMHVMSPARSCIRAHISLLRDQINILARLDSDLKMWGSPEGVSAYYARHGAPVYGSGHHPGFNFDIP